MDEAEAEEEEDLLDEDEEEGFVGVEEAGCWEVELDEEGWVRCLEGIMPVWRSVGGAGWRGGRGGGGVSWIDIET